MLRRPPKVTRTDTSLPSTALLRSGRELHHRQPDHQRYPAGYHGGDTVADDRTQGPQPAADAGRRARPSRRWRGRAVGQRAVGPRRRADTDARPAARRRQRRAPRAARPADGIDARSEEHTSELQSLMRISYAVFCLKKKKHTTESNL